MKAILTGKQWVGWRWRDYLHAQGNLGKFMIFIGEGSWLYTYVKPLNSTLNRCTSLYVNYNSVKLVKKKKGKLHFFVKMFCGTVGN